MNESHTKSLAPISVLIVEGEELGGLIADTLRPLGYQVVTVTNSTDAKSEIERQRHDIALIETRFARESCIPELLATAPWLKIVVITAYASIESAVKAMKLGAVDYLQKPFTPDALMDVIKPLVDACILEQKGLHSSETAALPPFEAYRGEEPFLFVSYAHRDGARVYPELDRLHRVGFRIWYDEGIDPGNEWPEEIARALARCAHFLVFISPCAVVSKNVRNEINFAINHGKPFLAIHIESTNLPQGLELRMGDIQAVMKYRMPEDRYHRQVEKTLPGNLLSIGEKQ